MIKIASEKYDDMKKLIGNKIGNEEVCELNFRDKDVILYGDTFIKFKHVGREESP